MVGRTEEDAHAGGSSREETVRGMGGMKEEDAHAGGSSREEMIRGDGRDQGGGRTDWRQQQGGNGQGGWQGPRRRTHRLETAAGRKRSRGMAGTKEKDTQPGSSSREETVRRDGRDQGEGRTD